MSCIYLADNFQDSDTVSQLWSRLSTSCAPTVLLYSGFGGFHGQIADFGMTVGAGLK